MEDVIHDCYCDIYGETPHDSFVKEILRIMPEEIIGLAKEWGPYDTVVREKVYEFILNL